MLDENVSWRYHIGLLCRAKQFLDETSLKTIYFSYIHSFLNYANIAWASTHFSKLKTISYKQKQAACIVSDEDQFQHINFMHRLNIDDLSKHFNNTFKKPDHEYPTKFLICNYSLKKHSLKSSKFAVSYRGQKLWNEFLSNEGKKIESQILFQKRLKSKLLDMENELSYF